MNKWYETWCLSHKESRLSSSQKVDRTHTQVWTLRYIPWSNAYCNVHTEYFLQQRGHRHHHQRLHFLHILIHFNPLTCTRTEDLAIPVLVLIFILLFVSMDPKESAQSAEHPHTSCQIQPNLGAGSMEQYA